METQRAELLLEVGRAEEAARLLSQGLAAEPDSVAGWCLLARCFDELGRPYDVLQATTRALQVGPTDEWAHRLHAHALLELKRPREALPAAEASVRLDPDNWRTHLTVAQVNQRLKRYRPAWLAAARARDLAPHEADAHTVCGDLLDDMSDYPGARAAYTEALRLDPAHHNARHNLAVIELNSGRATTASAGFGAAVAAAPNEQHYVRSATIVARSVLWRLSDWAALAFAVSLAARGISGSRVVAGPVAVLALAAYALGARRILRTVAANIRAELRRRLPRPIFALGLFSLVALLVGTVNNGFVDDHSIVAQILGIPAVACSLIAFLRVRNQLIRGGARIIRRTWFRAGRVPAR